MKRGWAAALALLAAGCAGPAPRTDATGAAGFEQDVADPAFRVRIPALPPIALEPHPYRAAKPHLRLMGSADPYVLSIGVPTADAGMTAAECAASGASWLVRSNAIPERGYHRARLNETTYLVVYGLPLQGVVQLNAYLFSGVAGTHCVQVHVSRMSRNPDDIGAFIDAFQGAQIDPL